MARSELGEAQRQLAVAVQVLAEDLHMAGAAHRLDGEDALAPLIPVPHREHGGAKLPPVPRPLPKRAVDELRRLHFEITPLVQAIAQIALDRAVERPTLGMPEHAAHRLFLLMEEVELTPEAAVVALFRLLELEAILLQRRLIRPVGVLFPLQRLVPPIPPP